MHQISAGLMRNEAIKYILSGLIRECKVYEWPALLNTEWKQKFKCHILNTLKVQKSKLNFQFLKSFQESLSLNSHKNIAQASTEFSTVIHILMLLHNFPLIIY